MAGSTIDTLIEIVVFLLDDIAKTIAGLFGLLGELGGNLDLVSKLGGPLGVVIAIIILAIVVYLLGRFILGTGKMFIFLAAVGLLLVLAVILLA